MFLTRETPIAWRDEGAQHYLRYFAGKGVQAPEHYVTRDKIGDDDWKRIIDFAYQLTATAEMSGSIDCVRDVEDGRRWYSGSSDDVGIVESLNARQVRLMRLLNRIGERVGDPRYHRSAPSRWYGVAACVHAAVAETESLFGRAFERSNRDG